jgi:hypothetical protein
MIHQKVAATKGQESKAFEGQQSDMEEAGVVLPADSQREDESDSRQKIHLRKFPAVLLPSPFTPINVTFSNFVGPVYAAGLRLDLQVIENNIQTGQAIGIRPQGKDKAKRKPRTCKKCCRSNCLDAKSGPSKAGGRNCHYSTDINKID